MFCMRMRVGLLAWNILIRCTSFHSALLEFKELKGLTESEKQTDFSFNGEQEKMNVWSLCGPKTLGTKGSFYWHQAILW